VVADLWKQVAVMRLWNRASADQLSDVFENCLICCIIDSNID
jgi:hypothetical protein